MATPTVTATPDQPTTSKLDSASIIKQLLAGDNETNSNNNSLIASTFGGQSTLKKQNSINAVSILLKNLLNPSAMEAIRGQSKTANSVKGGAGFGAKVNSKYLPSYNVRTPIVEISLNGYPIYPSKRIVGTATVVDSRLNFQSFNLKMPQGGMERSVTGELTLFSKNPQEILDYTESWATTDDKARSIQGLPTLALKFGWAFSDSTYNGSTADKQVNTVVAMSPEMHFIIINIAMEDPGAAGTTFTFTLRESGNVILENSSDNLIISSDYPQQQLRTLLEGIKGIRLFTLDDLLYLGVKNSDNEALGQKNSILKGEYNTLKISGGDNKTASALIGDTQEYTFFTNEKSSDVGINNRTFMNVANELAAQCRCKWYPHKNTDADADTKESTNANNELNNLAQDLKTIRSLPSGILPQDIAEGLVTRSKTGLTPEFSQILAGVGSGRLLEDGVSITKNLAEEALLAGLKANLTRLSARCRLVWVNNVPADWNTTGSLFFQEERIKRNRTNTPKAYREGAFFLLPELLDDYDVFIADMPVIYGPGASHMPYFYGSGQNILQASLGDKQPKMFGEVLSLSTSHNNLIVQLGSSVKEGLAYGVEGKRLTGLALAQGFESKDTQAKKKVKPVDPNAGDSPEQAKAKQEKLNAIINSKIEKLGLEQDPTEFSGSLALGAGGLMLGDDPNLVSGSEKSGINSDPGGMAKSAALRIRTRVANFLRWPTQTKITILGDPNLLRLGPGCFELFSYYPVENPDGTVSQELNALTTGVYFVMGIEHALDGNGFTTTLSGTKIVDPLNVPSSITNKLYSAVSAEHNTETTKSKALADAAGLQVNPNDVSKQLSDTLKKQFVSVDLASTEFTGGLLADELKKALSTFQAPPQTTKK